MTPGYLLSQIRRLLADGDDVEVVTLLILKATSGAYFTAHNQAMQALTPEERARVHVLKITASYGATYIRALELIAGGHVTTGAELLAEIENMHKTGIITCVEFFYKCFIYIASYLIVHVVCIHH